MVILRIIYTFIAVISLGSVDAVQLLSRVRHVGFSKKIINPVHLRTLFCKIDSNGFKQAVFYNACCKQKYYLKDGKAYRLGDEALPIAEDIVFGWKMSIIDGKPILKTNPILEEDKPRIEYLKKILLPYDFFPVIGFKEKGDIELSASANAVAHYITLSACMRPIIDDILARKPVITFCCNKTFKYSFPLDLAKMFIKFYMLHEAGHIYHQHHIVRDNLNPYQHEKEADAFAAQTFEGIVGGIITSKMKNEVMLNEYGEIKKMEYEISKMIYETAKLRYEINKMEYEINKLQNAFSIKYMMKKLFGTQKEVIFNELVPVYDERPLQEKKCSFEDLKALYFLSVGKSKNPLYKQHPSWIEREYFFREALEKFLQKNPSYYSRYEALKDFLKTDYKMLVR